MAKIRRANMPDVISTTIELSNNCEVVGQDTLLSNSL